MGIYDRSWYGRVLVERVEGYASPERLTQAYDEINAFEKDLVDWGAILLKFWVEVSPDEQLRRFEERQSNPAKQWKITDDDWRNREKYPQYKEAIEDMFRLTSTSFAPWIILESDDKRYAREGPSHDSRRARGRGGSPTSSFGFRLRDRPRVCRPWGCPPPFAPEAAPGVAGPPPSLPPEAARRRFVTFPLTVSLYAPAYNAGVGNAKGTGWRRCRQEGEPA